MACLARMDEEGGRAGAGRCCSYFPADVAGLSHAGDDDAAPAVKTNAAGTCKIRPEAGQLSPQPVDFNVERLAAEFDQARVGEVGIHRRMIQVSLANFEEAA